MATVIAKIPSAIVALRRLPVDRANSNAFNGMKQERTQSVDATD